MIGNFKFKEIGSEAFNLVCKSVKRPLRPPMKARRIDINGVSGIYDFGGGEYSLRPIAMRIAYSGDSFEELRNRARGIASWLDTESWARLIINDEPDKYYLARVIGEIDLIALKRFGEADINFECQPFAYSVDESIFAFNVNEAINYSFNNSGTRLINYKSPQGSKFLIKINGSWTDLSLSMNGSSLSYNEAASGELIIDSVEMEATLDGANKFYALYGDIDTFLSVVPGENILDVGGTGMDIIVTIEFIPMWL